MKQQEAVKRKKVKPSLWGAGMGGGERESNKKYIKSFTSENCL